MNNVITIQTTLNTAAEAHTLGEGITCALDGARVIGTPDVPGNIRVQISVPACHVDYVIGLLDADDRVFSYRNSGPC